MSALSRKRCVLIIYHRIQKKRTRCLATGESVEEAGGSHFRYTREGIRVPAGGIIWGREAPGGKVLFRYMGREFQCSGWFTVHGQSLLALVISVFTFSSGSMGGSGEQACLYKCFRFSLVIFYEPREKGKEGRGEAEGFWLLSTASWLLCNVFTPVETFLVCATYMTL